MACPADLMHFPHASPSTIAAEHSRRAAALTALQALPEVCLDLAALQRQRPSGPEMQQLERLAGGPLQPPAAADGGDDTAGVLPSASVGVNRAAGALPAGQPAGGSSATAATAAPSSAAVPSSPPPRASPNSSRRPAALTALPLEHKAKADLLALFGFDLQLTGAAGTTAAAAAQPPSSSGAQPAASSGSSGQQHQAAAGTVGEGAAAAAAPSLAAAAAAPHTANLYCSTCGCKAGLWSFLKPIHRPVSPERRPKPPKRPRSPSAGDGAAVSPPEVAAAASDTFKALLRCSSGHEPPPLPLSLSIAPPRLPRTTLLATASQQPSAADASHLKLTIAGGTYVPSPGSSPGPFGLNHASGNGLFGAVNDWKAPSPLGAAAQPSAGPLSAAALPAAGAPSRPDAATAAVDSKGQASASTAAAFGGQQGFKAAAAPAERDSPPLPPPKRTKRDASSTTQARVPPPLEGEPTLHSIAHKQSGAAAAAAPEGSLQPTAAAYAAASAKAVEQQQEYEFVKCFNPSDHHRAWCPWAAVYTGKRIPEGGQQQQQRSNIPPSSGAVGASSPSGAAAAAAVAEDESPVCGWRYTLQCLLRQGPRQPLDALQAFDVDARVRSAFAKFRSKT